MLGRRIAAGALFAVVGVSVAGVGTPAAAQSRGERGKQLDTHNTEVHRKKYAGWQRTANGTWVQPVNDPRYPGASPSGGAGVSTKDDMDADAFKPSAMIRKGGDEEYRPESRAIVRYEYAESPAYDETEVVVEPMHDGDVYVDHGSVYSQESSASPRRP